MLWFTLNIFTYAINNVPEQNPDISSIRVHIFCTEYFLICDFVYIHNLSYHLNFLRYASYTRVQVIFWHAGNVKN